MEESMAMDYGSSEGNINICLVERTTFRVHCVLVSKCSHPVSQKSTKSMWEYTSFFSTQAITHSLNTSWAKQLFFFFVISTGTNTPFCPHPFVSPLCLSNLAAVSLWTLAAPAASTAGPASLPLLLSPWSPWQKSTRLVSFLGQAARLF